jgi:hypothetical protein
MADYSADCNPAVFNRLARYLRDQSKPAPAQDASLTPKCRLRERPGITVASRTATLQGGLPL